jgi:hypothetical protein
MVTRNGRGPAGWSHDLVLAKGKGLRLAVCGPRANRLLRILRLREMVLVRENSSTLTSMSNLASLIWIQGRFEGAEQLEVGVMEARTSLLELEHTDNAPFST